MDEFENQICRLQCNLEDNGNLRDSIAKAISHELARDIVNIELSKCTWLELENLVNSYGSKKTKLLYEVLLKLDSIRKPLGEALALLKRVNGMDDDAYV